MAPSTDDEAAPAVNSETARQNVRVVTKDQDHEEIRSTSVSPIATNRDTCIANRSRNQIDTLASALFRSRTADTPVPDVYSIAAFLGKPNNTAVLKRYMEHFHFLNDTVLDALRRLAAHLFLHAETQMLDRILEQFAARYYECQVTPLSARASTPTGQSTSSTSREPPAAPERAGAGEDKPGSRHPSPSSTRSKYHGSEAPLADDVLVITERQLWKGIPHDRASSVIYLITFSLFLLNTDMHKKSGPAAAVMMQRMSKRDFIGNTIGAVRVYDLNAQQVAQLEIILRRYYGELKRNELQQPMFVQLRDRPPSSQGSPTASRKSMEEIRSPSKVKSSSASLYTIGSWRRKFTDSSTFDDSNSRRSVNSLKTLPSGVLLPAGGLRQTVMLRKHLWTPSGRPSNRTWRSSMMQMMPDHLIVLSGRQPSHPALKVANVHCLAGAFTGLPFLHYSTSKPHVWSLTLPDSSVWLFQAPSSSEMNEWISLINAWNARWSQGASLQAGAAGVGSSCFGWEQNVLDYISEGNVPRIMPWAPPEPILDPSTRNEADQLGHCNAQLRRNEAELASHISLSSTVERVFAENGVSPAGDASKSKSGAREWGKARQTASNNWRRRLEYLNREVGKWHIFTDALSMSTLHSAPPSSYGPSTEASRAASPVRDLASPGAMIASLPGLAGPQRGRKGDAVASLPRNTVGEPVAVPGSPASPRNELLASMRPRSVSAGSGTPPALNLDRKLATQYVSKVTSSSSTSACGSNPVFYSQLKPLAVPELPPSQGMLLPRFYFENRENRKSTEFKESQLFSSSGSLSSALWRRSVVKHSDSRATSSDPLTKSAEERTAEQAPEIGAREGPASAPEQEIVPEIVPEIVQSPVSGQAPDPVAIEPTPASGHPIPPTDSGPAEGPKVDAPDGAPTENKILAVSDDPVAKVDAHPSFKAGVWCSLDSAHSSFFPPS